MNRWLVHLLLFGGRSRRVSLSEMLLPTGRVAVIAATKRVLLELPSGFDVRVTTIGFLVKVRPVPLQRVLPALVLVVKRGTTFLSVFRLLPVVVVLLPVVVNSPE